MNKHFEILFLHTAFEFLSGLERKYYEKILYNIRKSQVELEPELFKKLSEDIWEFITLLSRNSRPTSCFLGQDLFSRYIGCFDSRFY